MKYQNLVGQLKGLPIINLLGIEKGEWVNAIIPVEEFVDDWFLFFTTKDGVSKRSPLTSFANIRNNGLIALSLREGDELNSVRLTDGTKAYDYWYEKRNVDSLPRNGC